ncbi:uncharacterized protein LOC124341686 isoform X1 [Daphnia pulicaria]|uniref:uncharacterized protein LOC124341686 isoform X1 n=1 Tax=Daphnia pulicaria TaxID=35523 RepID=UPI001EEA497D|nr:uncharacterized protein LOC124341686 isoform X1 [Daphnia pulicaria]
MARFKTVHPTLDEEFKLSEGENSINQPQKEPLRFHLDTTLLAPHLVDLVLEIQRIAESTLFHWKTFPLNLPQPIAVQEFSEGSASTRRKPLVVENLFDIPSWDDLDVVSVDAHGEAKHLSNKQLTSVRQHGITQKNGTWRTLTADQLRSISKTGSFTVASVNFPGQQHTWRVNPLLQKGSEVAMDSLLNTLAWSAAVINLTASERFTGDVFSVRKSIRSLRMGFHRFLDLIFGMPSLQPRDFESRLHEERSRYLVAELLCAVECQEEYIALCRFIRHYLAHQQTSGGSGRLSDVRQQKPPPLPYIFQTPKGMLIDLRLFSREIMDKVKPVVNMVLQQESKTRWSRHHVPEIKVDRKRNEAGHSGPDDDFQDLMNDEPLNRIWDSVLHNADVEQLGPGIAQLLVDQARATITMKRAVAKVRERFTADLIQAELDIRLRHPMLSLVKPWMDKQLCSVKTKLAKEYQWKCHEEAIEACRRKSLDQFVYFLSRDLAFLRDRAPILSKELWADKQATRSFIWDTWIWNPRAWIIRRYFQGTAEVIPTHLSGTPTSITNPRCSSSGSDGQEQPVYTLERSSRRTTTTQWPLWRWANFLQRAWVWSCNGAYACGYLVPWCSPIGLRALVANQPFYADLELSQVNGTLCPRRSAYTPTLNSRLASLWRHISKSRTEFETKPDTGFMGKGLTRQLNRAWNYGFKGLLCSLLFLLIFPVICILCSAGGICLALSAPVWAPVFALIYQVCIILVWDVDNPDPKRGPLLPMIRVLVRDLLLDGLLQPIACLVTAFIVCPLISLLLAVYGMLHWMTVRSRDAIIYSLAIRPRGRIPASEGFLVKRIAGPGLNTEFQYQISKEQALAAFEARLESDRLIAYRRQTERLIRRPAEEFRLFVQQVFSPFSGTAWCPTPVTEKPVDKADATASNFKSSNVAAQLERETQALLASLEEKVERRLEQLRMSLNTNALKKIRMSSADLKMVLVRSAMMMRTFYPTEILVRLGVNESELWERYNVEEGDWLALSAIFLSEIFSSSILNPLNDEETRIQLQAKDLNLGRYGAMFTQSDLDSEPFEWPQRAFQPAVVPLPDFSYFSPVGRDAANSSPPWKKKRTTQVHGHSGRLSEGVASWMGKSVTVSEPSRAGWNSELLIPLPVSHPVLICILIYNRHRDVGAIPLESESCRLLIRFLEGSVTLSRRKENTISRPPMLLDAAASRSPASHKPLLGSSGSDLALSQPSLAVDFSNTPSTSPSQHDTLVSIAQDGTLSLVGTLVSEHASVDIDMGLDQENIAQSLSASRDVDADTVLSKSLGSTLARAADTLRMALLGEKAEETSSASGGRNKYAVENFELLPSSDEHLAATNTAPESRPEVTEKSKKFPTYQPASFRSWRMNLPSPIRYDSDPRLRTSVDLNQPQPTSPRPLGLFELSRGLALDRGPAFSPAQLSIGRRLMERGEMAASGSQDSLPFAEEDASLVDSPDCDLSKNAPIRKNPETLGNTGQSYCEVQTVQQSRPAAVLASIEDLSLSIDSQHTHLDITSQLGTQV